MKKIHAAILALIIVAVSIGVFLADPEHHPYEAVLDGMAFLVMSISATLIIILGLFLLAFVCAKFFCWLARKQTLWWQVSKEFFRGVCYSAFLIALVFGAITYSEAGQQLVNLPLTSSLTDGKGNLTAGTLLRASDATYVNTSGVLSYSRGNRTNLVLYSEDTSQANWVGGTTQTFTLTVNTTYLLSVHKAGVTLTLAAGTGAYNVLSGTTATYGSPVAFTMTTGGTVTVTTDTANPKAQLEALPSGNTIGSDLMDAGAGVFTSGTYGWAVYGTNTIANVSNALEVTYVDDAKGAQLALSAASDLSSDLTVGETYQVSLKSKVNSGSVTVEVRDTSDAVLASYAETATSLTTRILYFKATNASTNKLSFSGMGAGEVVTIDDLTIKSVPDLAYLSPGTYTATTGSTATIPAEPRFETNGLLVEGESTNLFSYSSPGPVTSGTWTIVRYTGTGSQTGPDGSSNAVLLMEVASSGVHAEAYIGLSTETVADNATVTFSAFVKKHTTARSFACIYILTKANASKRVYLNLDNSTVGTQDSGYTGTITQLGSTGWFRISITGSIGTGTTQPLFYVCASNGDGGVNYLGDTSYGMYVSGFQLEATAYPTSYIPTNGCPVTRLTEAGSATNGYRWTMSTALKNALGAASPSRGTMLVEWTPGYSVAPTAHSNILATADSTTNIIYNSNGTRNVRSTDGTNVPTWGSAQVTSSILYLIVVRFDSTANSGAGYLQVSEKHSGTWTHGTATNYDGAFTLGTYLRLAYGNEYPFWIKNIAIYDGWVADGNLDHPKKPSLFPILPLFGGVKKYTY